MKAAVRRELRAGAWGEGFGLKKLEDLREEELESELEAVEGADTWAEDLKAELEDEEVEEEEEVILPIEAFRRFEAAAWMAWESNWSRVLTTQIGFVAVAVTRPGLTEQKKDGGEVKLIE